MRRVFIASICAALVHSQSFPNGFSYDFDIPTLSGSCQAALNETVQCSWMLPLNDLEGLELSKDNLTTICTSDCRSSLKAVAKSVRSACPVSSNHIVVDDIAYPATETIDRLTDLYDKICLKDVSTGDFCYSIMESWQDQDNLTEEQSCSDCLLGMLSLDQSSGFSYNAAFESNFSAMTASCGKTGYEPTKPTPIALNSSIEATTIPTPSCVSSYTVRADDTCGAISNANNVSTFALTLANELDAYCQGPLSVGTELCIPVSCDIYTVRQNDTCRSVAAAQPSYITITQLQAWNPNLNRLCTNMEQQVDTQVCVGPPGGTLAAPSNTAAQPSAPTTTASVPADIANGTNVRCAKYYTVVAGDTCGDITIRNGISLSDFYFLNAGINSECTNLFAQESYCILPVGNIATYSGYGGGYATMKCTGAGSPSTCYGDYALLSPTPFLGQAAQATASRSSAQPSATACSVTFVVNRETSFGSSVRIVGSISELGTWDLASSLAMGSSSYTTSNPVWNITLGLPCGTSGEYKYILDADGTNTWETTGNRNFIASSGSITVQDSWERAGATTVTNAISTTPPSASSTRTASKTASTAQVNATACSVTFIVDKITQKGETVRLVGSDAQLGAWDPSASVALSDEQYSKAVPMWYVTMDLPFGVEYKYISVLDGATTWESTPNRNIDGDACKTNGGEFVAIDTWENSSATSSSVASASSTKGTSSTKPTATACSATFIVERETQFGESVSLVGAAAQLGSWNAASAVALDASGYTTENPVWSATLILPFESTQYKYILMSGGSTTWEDDPNRDFDGNACKSNGGSMTIRSSWNSATSTSDGSTAARPSPTQEGLSSQCSNFYFVKSGNGCYDIAASYGVSLDNFYTYNPAVGSDCSKLWPDYYVCVGVSG